MTPTDREVKRILLEPEGDDFLPGGRFYAGDDEGEEEPIDDEEEGMLDKEIRRERAAERRRGW